MAAQLARSESALSIWIWGAGSYWDIMFNSYMNTPGTMIVAPMSAILQNLTANNTTTVQGGGYQKLPIDDTGTVESGGLEGVGHVHYNLSGPGSSLRSISSAIDPS